MGEFTKQDFDKILAELKRIGDAVEFLAIKAGPEFRPTDPTLKQLKENLQKAAARPTKRPGPGE